MLTANRTPEDHFLSAGLNNFFTTNNIERSLKAGAISYFAISTSNNIAKKDYKNAMITALGGILINQLGENTMAKNPYLEYDKNYGYGNGYGMNNPNCPYNPYLNNQNQNGFNGYNQNGFNGYGYNGYGYNQNNQNGFFRNLSSQGNGVLGNPMVKGLLIGAAVAYLLSNKDAKDALAKGVAKLQSFASATVEEFKEQIEDAKASMQE